MPKASKKYYAVAVGRDGPKIYATWDECNEKVRRYPKSVFKSFPSFSRAEEWLASQIRLWGTSSPLSVASDIRLISHVGLQSRKSPSAASVSSPQDFITSPHPDPLITRPECIEEEYISLRAPTTAPLLSSSYHPRPASMSLSPEQRHVLDLVKRGRSVFFTGSAGTGKSVLLREIIEMLETRGKIGITASTGIAAINIGGCTLHSWAGIGIGNEPASRYIGKFFGNKSFQRTLQRWQQVKTLIIDEVSMIDGSLFDKLEDMARALRKSDFPFGGIQLVLSGDFCQLPPVPGRDQKGQQVTPVLAFDARAWDTCVGPPVILTRVFRQKDQDFADMLNAMRFGNMDAKAVETFSTLSRNINYTDGIGPTELFSTRREVSNSNDYRLGQLKTETHSYMASERPGIDSNGERISSMQMDRLLERLVVPKSIILKVGAQVMLVKNLVQGELVNGSIGQIIRFSTARDALKAHTDIPGFVPGETKLPPNDTLWPIVRFIGGRASLIIPYEFTINNANGDVEASRTQVPLILAWALSIHKSQGQTLERVKVDLKRIFEVGQAYVALSRATRLEGLQVLNFDATKVVAHPRVLEWYSSRLPLDHATTDHVIDLTDVDDYENDRFANLESKQREIKLLSQEVIDLSDSDDEKYDKNTMSWYYDP